MLTGHSERYEYSPRTNIKCGLNKRFGLPRAELRWARVGDAHPMSVEMAAIATAWHICRLVITFFPRDPRIAKSALRLMQAGCPIAGVVDGPIHPVLDGTHGG